MAKDSNKGSLSPPKAGSQDPGQAPLDPVAAALADTTILRHLLNAALAMLRNRHLGWVVEQRQAEAEEVLQEVAQRALGRRPDYDPERPIVSWLIGFVVMVCKERTRNRLAV